MKAEESILLTIQLLDGRMVSLIMPTVQFVHYYEDTVGKTSEMIIPVDIEDGQDLKIDDMITGIFFDASNDPTPKRAGAVISLGYYTLRLSYKYCRVKSLTPLTLIGIGGDDKNIIIDSHFTRPLRRVTI
jgi:hypothetical protein